jgi:catechol 2,3-dioxygenase-like lactoylglutathione lyase family enzyme
VSGLHHITFSVRDRADLDAWAAHLDALGVPHLPVTAARVGDSLQLASDAPCCWSAPCSTPPHAIADAR